MAPVVVVVVDIARHTKEKERNSIRKEEDDEQVATRRNVDIVGGRHNKENFANQMSTACLNVNEKKKKGKVFPRYSNDDARRRNRFRFGGQRHVAVRVRAEKHFHFQEEQNFYPRRERTNFLRTWEISGQMQMSLRHFRVVYFSLFFYVKREIGRQSKTTIRIVLERRTSGPHKNILGAFQFRSF